MTTIQPTYRSLAPPVALRPDVLPTERLFASGKAKPGASPQMRSIRDRRNGLAVVSVYTQIFGSWALVAWLDHPLIWALMFIWSARCISLLNLLNHEGVHALLFSHRPANDMVARYFLAPLALTDFDAYRKVHLAHHKDELGPEEPDVSMYAPYPSGGPRLVRRLLRDLSGVSAAKLLGAINRAGGSIRRRIIGAQIILGVIAFAITGQWWAWLVVWFLPWMTTWQVTNRLRAVAEHGGMERGSDRRVTTHIVRPGPVASFMLAPYQAGFHLAHHVDTSVPWTQLRNLHNELAKAGWVTPQLTHPNYRSLWRYLASGER